MRNINPYLFIYVYWPIFDKLFGKVSKTLNKGVYMNNLSRGLEW